MTHHNHHVRAFPFRETIHLPLQTVLLAGDEKTHRGDERSDEGGEDYDFENGREAWLSSGWFRAFEDVAVEDVLDVTEEEREADGGEQSGPYASRVLMLPVVWHAAERGCEGESSGADGENQGDYDPSVELDFVDEAREDGSEEELCYGDGSEENKRYLELSHGGESCLDRHEDSDADVDYWQGFVVELVGSYGRVVVVVFLGGEDDEREEEEREPDGLEESLSPNAVVLAAFVVFASVDLFVVQVFEEFGYGLAYDGEDGWEENRRPVVWFSVWVYECGWITLDADGNLHKMFCKREKLESNCLFVEERIKNRIIWVDYYYYLLALSAEP